VAAATGTLALFLVLGGPAPTENAVANGDTRTIHLYHTHSKESIDATYMVDGRYDPAMLKTLDHFLRDWRNDDEINMDPKLFDVIWETYRESGSTQPINVVSAYRSPTTNAMLRRRSKLVAEHSQHMLGKAMDMHYTDVPMSKIREIGLRLQRGGVGYYPTAGVPFVHLDVGNVRYWPRMSYPELAKLFPDGKAVFVASDGRMLPNYQEARAEIASRSGNETETVVASAQPKNFFAMLFGGGDDQRGTEAPPAQKAVASVPSPSLQSASLRDSSKVASAADAGAQASAVPMPPRRPIELAALTLNSSSAPLPPMRPSLGAPAGAMPANGGVTSVLRAANAPAVIMRGVVAPGAMPSGGALAYAAPLPNDAITPTIEAVRTASSPQPSAVVPAVGLRAAALQRPVAFVAARLDPSNFAALVTPTSIVSTMSDSEVGSSVGSLRSAARYSLADLVFGPPSPVAARFGAAVSDLHMRDFAGAAVRPLSAFYSTSRREPLRTADNSGID
jgi:uncharacterized protein YcbK (DUF882 family)